jgi:hypothetical protein
VNRETRLRRLLDGTGLEDQAATLAANPEADLIVSALKAGRDAAVKHAADLRKRQRQERKYDADQLGEAVGRLLAVLARRSADGDLEAGASLYGLEARVRRLLQEAVDGLRVTGYSDPEIAAGFSTTRQAIGQRFGRKRVFTPDSRGGES